MGRNLLLGCYILRTLCDEKPGVWVKLPSRKPRGTKKKTSFSPVPAFGAFLDLVIGHYPTRSELAEANQEGLATWRSLHLRCPPNLKPGGPLHIGATKMSEISLVGSRGSNDPTALVGENRWGQSEWQYAQRRLGSAAVQLSNLNMGLCERVNKTKGCQPRLLATGMRPRVWIHLHIHSIF